MTKLILFNKPYQVLSQFSTDGCHPTLKEFIPIKSVYPAGRLDYDSEGLLLLTDCGKLQQSITHPKKKMTKTYWVQVEKIPYENDLNRLRQGLKVKDIRYRPAKVRLIDEPSLWLRSPPIRKRKSISTSWLEISITEGKNRQIRKMTAAIGYPTLRLVRVQIGPWQLGELQPGEYQITDHEA